MGLAEASMAYIQLDKVVTCGHQPLLLPASLPITSTSTLVASAHPPLMPVTSATPSAA